jgi:hypothetical protein
VSGVIHVVCAWCGAALGEKPCASSEDGATSHGICPACAERQFGVDVTAESFAAHSPESRCDVARRAVAELQPREWAWPHDWRELAGEVFINRAALPLLVGVLATSGEGAAAGQLMSYLMENLPRGAAARSDQKLGLDGSGRTTAAPARIGTADGQTQAPPRQNWARDWEKEHDL